MIHKVPYCKRKQLARLKAKKLAQEVTLTDLYSVGAWSVHRLYWMRFRVILLSPFRQCRYYYLILVHERSLPSVPFNSLFTNNHIVTCIRDYRRGLDWMTGFIYTLYTGLGTTSKYSAIAYLHTLQFTAAHTRTLGFSVFTSRILTTDL
jgi:hypothetical protein